MCVRIDRYGLIFFLLLNGMFTFMGYLMPKLSLCLGYDTKQSDGDVPVMMELWGMRSTPSLPFLPGHLWPGVVALDRVLSMGQIELHCILMIN